MGFSRLVAIAVLASGCELAFGIKDPSPGCDPLTQLDCSAGEKCTAVVAPDDDHLACVTAGSAAIGSACMFANGVDNCMRGTVCINGDCKRFCDPKGGEPSCPAIGTCSLVPQLLIDSVGVCAND